VNPFDATRRILTEASSTRFGDRFEAFFVDYGFVPLLVQQNYIDSIK
jgi:hypothetical protein